MQFLESSVLGLRSARHVLRTDQSPTEITLYPMVHVGDAAFYEKVYARALDHDVCLYEGVNSKRVMNLTRSYRWIGVGRMGLVLQPKLANTDGRGARILADMPPEEFDEQWARIPWRIRSMITLAAPVFGALRRIGMTRARLSKRMDCDDLRSREDTLVWSKQTRDFLNLIQTQRDKVLVDCLSAQLAKTQGAPRSISVVYGAAHMPAVTRFLAKHANYRVVESEWLTVIAA